MKKIISAVAAFVLVLSTVAYPVFAADSVSVYVTISDGTGGLAVAQEKINLEDTDSDGLLTINDALFTVHEKKYNGGAAAGYTSSETEYGLSLIRLWGVENGGSYGYCINNISAMSLNDTIADGDYINAYAFSDLTAWSDVYSSFDANVKKISAGEEFILTLEYTGYDADWNTVILPVSNAVITVNGKESNFITDANGKAVIELDEAGEYIISAVSDTQTLVPPVCKVTVISGTTDITEAPATGNSVNALLVAAAISLVTAFTVKKYEK